MYKLPIKVLVGEDLVQPNFVCKLGEQPLSIPFDPANTDYQAFLAWKAEGNEPEPADATPVADTQGEQ